MRIKYFSLFVILTFLSFSFTAKSQDDLLKLVDTAKSAAKLPPTWKDTRLINVQTTKVVDPAVMEFFILHRFGDAGTAQGGAFHTLYGFDIASDIQFAFQFGIVKNLMIGISRSKQQELIDLDIKYKVLTQNSTGTPVSLALYGDAGITPELNSTFYNGADTATPKSYFMDKLSYLGEMIIDRRFSKHLSLELLGGMQHRNYVLANINANNGATDQNNIPYVGAGGRIMFNKHSSLVFDYYYVISQYRMNNTAKPYFSPISIGYEVETGGHVFEINFSNAAYLDENNIIPYTTEGWVKGGFKLGFSISRVFNI